MEGGKGEVLDVKSLYVVPSDTSNGPVSYRSIMRVVVGQSSLRRLAILRLPGLPASQDFPDDLSWMTLPRTRFLGLLGELKLEWFLSTTDAR